MKKTNAAREMRNTYPAWSKIRSSDQSVGAQILEAIAQPMERMTKQLEKHLASQFLATRFVNDIDQIYSVQLPTSVDFVVDTTDPNNPQYTIPAVLGLSNAVWYPLTIATNNDIQSFWYDCIPNRYEIGDSILSTNSSLISDTVDNFPYEGTYNHHLYTTGSTGGYIYVECTGGIQYVTVDEDRVRRAQIILHGKTRKGTLETETLVFPWDMKQRSRKQWRYLTKVEVYDMESSVTIDITSNDINGPYISHWNLAWSNNRRKVDEFWDISYDADLSLGKLDYYRYISDEWEKLIIGFSNKEVLESFELLDNGNTTIDPVDIAVQPFSDRAWIADSTNKVYLYELTEELPNMNLLKGRTSGSEVQFEVETNSVVLGEDIRILPWHIRPVREIRRYRIWYQTPSGNKFGLLDGSPVAFNTNFWVFTQTIQRSIGNTIELTSSERGDYLFVLEVQYEDEQWQYDRVVIPVKYKTPLAQFDIDGDITGDITAIYFDADNKLWVQTDLNNHYQIKDIADVMLIDYQNKQLYFKEIYEEVDVDVNG